MKKIFLLSLFLLTFGMMNAFAYDGSVYGGLDGTFSREDFDEQAGDPDVAIGIIESLGVGELDKFYQVTEDSADEEDLQVFEDISEYIDENYKVKNNQGYSFVVVRTQTDEVLDGWVIFYHYSKKAETPNIYYIYYFGLEL